MVSRAHHKFFLEKLEQAKPSGKHPGDGPSRSDDTPNIITNWFTKLSFQDSVCWAFNVTPKKVVVIYWSHSLKQIQDYVRLQVSWHQAQAFQQYQTMAIIVRQAFGAKSSEPPVKPPETMDEAKAQFAALWKTNG